jgi:hypothetical protein
MIYGVRGLVYTYYCEEGTKARSLKSIHPYCLPGGTKLMHFMRNGNPEFSIMTESFEYKPFNESVNIIKTLLYQPKANVC